MEEIWKDIAGYEGKYMVSNLGRVKSVERMKWNGSGYYKTPERILKARQNQDSYLYVRLCKDGKVKACTIHRLVAQAFLDNPDNLPQVNHIDENKENNHADNLEWVTCRENMNHGTRNHRIAEKNTNNPNRSKPVFSVDKVTGEIKEFPSIAEAGRKLGISNGNICECLKGKRKNAGNFYWMYANSEEACNE